MTISIVIGHEQKDIDFPGFKKLLLLLGALWNIEEDLCTNHKKIVSIDPQFLQQNKAAWDFTILVE